MATIERRSRMGHPPPGKRLVRGWPLATPGRMLLAAMTAALTGAIVAGCDGGHDDLEARSPAADARPMLPGTRGTAAPAPSAGAQRFDTSDGMPLHAASDPLLPPVMHTAD